MDYNFMSKKWDVHRKERETKGNDTWNTYNITFMGFGRGGALASPWIFKIAAKKGCFLGFERENANLTTFGPLEKFWKSPLVAPAGQQSSDAHACIIQIIETFSI